MKIKKIYYKIFPKGRWKSDEIAKVLGRYTYPILLTIIEDTDGNILEIPLSYNQIGSLIEKQIFLERYIDEILLKGYKDDEGNDLRKSYSQKIIDGINMIMKIARQEDIKKIKGWIKENEEKEKTGFPAD